MISSDTTLGAFILTYFRPKEVQKYLEILLSQTVVPEVILVVDNAGEKKTKEIVDGFRDSRIIYEGTESNLGPAGGTELAYEQLVRKGCDFILSGDDDNPPRTTDTVEKLMHIYREDRRGNLGGVGVVGTRWDWKRGRLIRLRDEELAGPVEVDFIGGNHKPIYTRKALLDAGLPNRKLFFGYDDLDLCLRIRRAGYRLLVDGDLMRKHRELVNHLEYKPGPLRVLGRPYSALWRNYYTTRNLIFLMRDEFDRPDLARRHAVKAMLSTLPSWARGPKYGSRFTRLQIKALIHGYKGTLGATVMPIAKKKEV